MIFLLIADLIYAGTRCVLVLLHPISAGVNHVPTITMWRVRLLRKVLHVIQLVLSMIMSINGKAAQKKALVVGISDYTSLQKLDFCRNNGTEVYEVQLTRI